MARRNRNRRAIFGSFPIVSYVVQYLENKDISNPMLTSKPIYRAVEPT